MKISMVNRLGFVYEEVESEQIGVEKSRTTKKLIFDFSQSGASVILMRSHKAATQF